MEMNFATRGIGNTARILLSAVAAVLVSAPVSAGPGEDEALAVCSETLTAEYGAIGLSDARARRFKTQRYFAYATARLADGESIRFRCLVRGGTARAVDVYAPVNPAIVDSRARWTSAEPYRVTPEPGAEVPAEPTPEQEIEQSEVPVEIDPQFKASGAGTGFKTPGAAKGSRFKPAK